jgi:hypothetical protein
MSKSKKLSNKISSKLDQLQKLLEQIEEVQIMDSNEPDTWDSDALYNLSENLKAALALLEDKESKSEKDNFGNPLILEVGLCSLMDEYTAEGEEEEDF